MADYLGCLDNIPRVERGLLTEGVRLAELAQRMSFHLGKELGKEHLVGSGLHVTIDQGQLPWDTLEDVLLLLPFN